MSLCQVCECWNGFSNWKSVMQTDRTDKKIIQRCGRMTRLPQGHKVCMEELEPFPCPKGQSRALPVLLGSLCLLVPQTSFCAKAWSTNAPLGTFSTFPASCRDGSPEEVCVSECPVLPLSWVQSALSAASTPISLLLLLTGTFLHEDLFPV